MHDIIEKDRDVRAARQRIQALKDAAITNSQRSVAELDAYNEAIHERDIALRSSLDDPHIEIPPVPQRPDGEGISRRAIGLMNEIDTAESELRTTLAAKSSNFVEQLADREKRILADSAALITRIAGYAEELDGLAGSARELEATIGHRYSVFPHRVDVAAVVAACRNGTSFVRGNARPERMQWNGEPRSIEMDRVSFDLIENA